jgi:hypothetical protein
MARKPLELNTTHMIRIYALTAVALSCCVSCVQNGRYQPVATPEQTEYSHDHVDVYPDEVRENLGLYTNTPVVWVGVIQNSDAQEEDVGGKIRVLTTFDHHYFDWREKDDSFGHVNLHISPRGEGQFRARWYMRRKYPDAGADDAEQYASPGKLAIFYGVPVSVDPDGTVVLGYRYVRVLDEKEFSTNGAAYGRLGDPMGLSPTSFH